MAASKLACAGSRSCEHVTQDRASVQVTSYWIYITCSVFPSLSTSVHVLGDLQMLQLTVTCELSSNVKSAVHYSNNRDKKIRRVLSILTKKK